MGELKTWMEKDGGSLRVDQIGDVARPFSEEEVEHFAPFAQLVAAGRLPSLALLGPVLASLGGGRRPARGQAASSHVGPIADALVAMLSLDAREIASRRAIHDAVRALDSVCLDAVEDMLARFNAARPLLEAERMWRHGLLCEDWCLVLSDVPAGPGRISARVVAPIRQAVADA